MQFNSQMDLVEGSIPKKMVVYALPILLSGWLQLLFSTADLVICSKFGHTQNAVGAISETQSLSYLIISLFAGLTIGSNVLIGRAYGARNKEAGNRVVGTSYLIAIVSSVILLAIGVTCSRLFLTWMGCPDDIIENSTTYMTIYFIGVPFLIVFDFGASIMRGMGDSLKPFLYLTAAGLINVALNFLFVIAFKLDVAGVAITTVISEFLCALAVTLDLALNKNSFASLKKSYLHFYKSEVKEIIHIGLPAGVQGSLFAISNVIIQTFLNDFGSGAVSGIGAASSIESFLNVAQDSFAQAGVAFISANYGAKNVERIKKSIAMSMIYACGISLLLGVVVICIPHQLLTLYLNEDATAAFETGVQKLLIMGSSYVLFAVVDTLSSIERGLGYSTSAMIISLAGIAGLRLLYLYTFFGIPEYHTIFWLYMSYPISWFITSLAHLICYLSIRKKAFSKCLACPEDNKEGKTLHA